MFFQRIGSDSSFLQRSNKTTNLYLQVCWIKQTLVIHCPVSGVCSTLQSSSKQSLPGHSPPATQYLIPKSTRTQREKIWMHITCSYPEFSWGWKYDDLVCFALFALTVCSFRLMILQISVCFDRQALIKAREPSLGKHTHKTVSHKL